MRKVISAVIEEMMLILYLVWVGNNVNGRFESTEQLWSMGITIGITIAIAKAIEAVVDYALGKKEKEPQQAKYIKQLAMCFALISPFSFLAFNALEYFGNMPVTNKTLVIISLGFTFCHLLISHVLDVLMGLNKESQKHIFSEEYMDDDLDDDI